jgi:hypothetical protein
MKSSNAVKSIGALVLALAMATNLALAGVGNVGNPGIAPPQASSHGMAYGEWSGEWWQWAYSFPMANNPVSDPTGALASLGQSGPVWFLAGTYGTVAERTVTVPPGKALFFPIVNTIWVNLPELGDNPWSDEQRAFAKAYIAPFIDSAFNLTCQIDGVEVKDITAYRCQTPDGEEYMVTFPTNDNPWGGAPYFLPAGTYGPCVDDGIYLMVAPLSAGEHTIHFTAATSAWGPFALEVTYHLTVEK